jgi:hypothetical protein
MLYFTSNYRKEIEDGEKAGGILLDNQKLDDHFFAQLIDFFTGNLDAAKKITAVDFSGNNFTKADVSIFKEITFLNVNQNNINTISGLSMCTKLHYLQLRGNKLESLPGVHMLTKLRAVNLAENLFETIPDFSTLDELNVLNLNGNKLPNILNLPIWVSRISTLMLQSNKLNLVQGLNMATNLKELFLNDNQISIVPDFSMCQKLSGLRLRDNPLTEVSKLVVIELVRNGPITCLEIDGYHDISKHNINTFEFPELSEAMLKDHFAAFKEALKQIDVHTEFKLIIAALKHHNKLPDELIIEIMQNITGSPLVRFNEHFNYLRTVFAHNEQASHVLQTLESSDAFVALQQSFIYASVEATKALCSRYKALGTEEKARTKARTEALLLAEYRLAYDDAHKNEMQIVRYVKPSLRG